MKASSFFACLLLSLASALFILPVAALAAAAVSAGAGISFIRNFSDVITKPRTMQAFASGLSMSSAASALSIFLSTAAATALSRRSDAASRSLISFILLLGGLPFSTLVIPLYFALFTLRLTDSVPVTVLFLAAANIPANVWIIERTLSELPREAEETARLDGASMKDFLPRILLPQLAPVLTGSFITTFINCWGNFIVPFILLSSSRKMPAALAFFQAYSGAESGATGYLAAYAALYYLPVIALYLMLRLGMSRIFVLHRLKT